MAVYPQDKQEFEQRMQQINQDLERNISLVREELERNIQNLRYEANNKIQAMRAEAEDLKNQELENAKSIALQATQDEIQQMSNIEEKYVNP